MVNCIAASPVATVLLLVYVGAYRINSKIYHVVINGRTGELQGKRLWSWIKITTLVLVILILFTLLIMRILAALRIF